VLTGETQRSRIIILAAHIDHLPLEILTKHLKPKRGKTKDEDKLFGRMRPLTSFSARIEMAYRLGLISEEAAQCYDILRDVRNDCAHKLVVDFRKFRRFSLLTREISSLAILFDVYRLTGQSDEDLFTFLCVCHQIFLEATLKNTNQVAERFLRPATFQEQVNFVKKGGFSQMKDALLKSQKGRI